MHFISTEEQQTQQERTEERMMQEIPTLSSLVPREQDKSDFDRSSMALHQSHYCFGGRGGEEGGRGGEEGEERREEEHQCESKHHQLAMHHLLHHECGENRGNYNMQQRHQKQQQQKQQQQQRWRNIEKSTTRLAANVLCDAR